MLMEAFVALMIIGLGIWVYLLDKQRKNDYWSKLTPMLTIRDDLHKTLLAGLYQRFKKEDGKTEDTPYDFEPFVAKVMQEFLGGKTETTPRSGDGGVDIRHHRDTGLYLGQVKCYAPNNAVDYVPIAVLHSQMIKQGARGGFVVTTSTFNDGAVRYASDLNIKLIDGQMFLHMWIETMERTKETCLPPELTSAY